MKKYLLKSLKIVVILLTGYYLYTAIHEDISQLKPDILKTSHLLALSGVLLIFAVFFLIKTVNWYIILKQCGGQLKFSEASKIWFGSQTIKYLPGKVWFIIARLYFGRGVVTAPLVFVSTMVELILMLLSATLIFFVLGGYHFARFIETQWMAIGVAVFVLPTALVIIHPFFLNKIMTIIGRISRSPIEPLMMKYGQIFRLLISYCLNWLLFGIANYMILNTLSSDWPPTLLQTMSIFPISYVIGFISFLTPGGIGVRESIQVYLLGQIGYASAIAAAVAIISRIFWMGCEVIGALIFVGLKNVGNLRLKQPEKDQGTSSRR